MGIIALLLCFGFLLNSFINKNDKFLGPNKLFYLLWTIILLFSNMRLLGLIKPSNEAYFLITMMLVFFWIGYKGQKFIKFKKFHNYKINMYCIKYKTFYFACICILIFNMIDIYMVIIQIKKGIQLWQIRNWILEPFGSDNPIIGRIGLSEQVIRTIIIEPLKAIIPIISAYDFFYDKKHKQKIMVQVFSILVLVTSTIAGVGGRFSILCFILYYFMAFIIFEKVKKIDIKKYKKLYIIFASVALMIVILYTTLRTGKGNFFRQFYKYFSIPPTLLSLWLENIKNIPHTYGLLTTFGIHSYIFRGLKIVGLNFLVPDIYDKLYTYITNAEKFLNVGIGNANAFVTPIYYFYIDGGYIFTIIASTIFGILISRQYEKLQKNINIKNFIIYALIMYGIFTSFMRVQTVIPTYIISFLMVNLLVKEVENEE